MRAQLTMNENICAGGARFPHLVNNTSQKNSSHDPKNVAAK
jgi:hypothetical protein